MASTSSSRSLPRPANRESFSIPSEFDLFFQLIYMSAAASAGVSRGKLFQMASALLRAPAEYFRRIHLLCEKLGYNYPSACIVVGQKSRSEAMRTFLLRFADALSSGHPEVNFLSEESEVQREVYEKQSERDLASLTKWTDAYGAIMVSAALIIIVNLTSTMIYDLGTSIIIVLVLIAILSSSGGAWVISRAAPSEPESFFRSDGSRKQRLALLLAQITTPAAVLVCLLLAVLGVRLGWVLVIGGLFLLPLGILSMQAAKEVERKDKEIGPFLRSFGAMTVATGTTLAEALNQMDLSSFPALLPDTQRLGWRLKAAMPPSLCWKKFATETGSRLIADTIRIFHDAIELGGDAEKVGSLCSQFATTEVMIRARRKVTASTFANLTIVMHGAIGALMIIILEVIRNFNLMVTRASAELQQQESLSSMQLPMLSFGSPMLGTLGTLTYAMVIVLAAINAYAIIAADGGHILKASFYLSILLALSGISFLIMPPFVASLLKVGG